MGEGTFSPGLQGEGQGRLREHALEFLQGSSAE